MPRYEFICSCDEESKIFVIRMNVSEYMPEVPCPCGKGIAKRKFNGFFINHGLTANEKKSGTNPKRKEMADYVKEQKNIRKQSYAPDSREAKTNELWTGKEGLDGITSLPIDKWGKKKC